MRLGELEGKGHCAKSEGITDTFNVVLIPEMNPLRYKLAYFIARDRGYRRGRVGMKQVVVRVQRRVRMGVKDELGPLYILSHPQIT